MPEFQPQATEPMWFDFPSVAASRLPLLNLLWFPGVLEQCFWKVNAHSHQPGSWWTQLLTQRWGRACEHALLIRSGRWTTLNTKATKKSYWLVTGKPRAPYLVVYPLGEVTARTANGTSELPLSSPVSCVVTSAMQSLGLWETASFLLGYIYKKFLWKFELPRIENVPCKGRKGDVGVTCL